MVISLIIAKEQLIAVKIKEHALTAESKATSLNTVGLLNSSSRAKCNVLTARNSSIWQMSVGRRNSSRTRQTQIAIGDLRYTLIQLKSNREDSILMIRQTPKARLQIHSFCQKRNKISVV